MFFSHPTSLFIVQQPASGTSKTTESILQDTHPSGMSFFFIIMLTVTLKTYDNIRNVTLSR
jgi:hypothetical protein